ncbi:MAG: hypothetical protein ACLR76_04220 [Alistipes sp.]
MEKTYADSITSEAVNLLPTGSFPGEIVVVDRSELIADACAYLSECDVIGFDTETRPSFTKGVMNKVSLLQLSSGERAFLFRLNRVALEKPLLQLLSSDRVVKAGVAIRDDIRVLRQSEAFHPGRIRRAAEHSARVRHHRQKPAQAGGHRARRPHRKPSV